MPSTFYILDSLSLIDVKSEWIRGKEQEALTHRIYQQNVDSVECERERKRKEGKGKRKEKRQLQKRTPTIE